MPKSPQDVYARHLLSPRGYPLWTPEPSQQLLAYRRDGLRIGDVGVVIPEDGCFDVFFNICLPEAHPFHQATGVPDNFKPVELSDVDIRTVVDAENRGRVITNSSVKCFARTVRRAADSSSRTPPPELEYEFTLSSSEGALLVLPDGADRHDLRNHHRFLEAAIQHGAGWYRFAEEKVGQIIANDSLYLITGLYKTTSWSLAAFEKTTGATEYSAQLRISQARRGNVAATCTWDTTRALDWRVGPREKYEYPNQAVFIRGFKIALRTGMLGTKWISVKADAPSTRLNPARSSGAVPGDSWLAYVFGGPSIDRTSQPSGSGTQDEVVVDSAPEDARDEIQNKGALAIGEHVVIRRVPETSQAFHPSDIINRYLLDKEPSANIAITHDDIWTAILGQGPPDLVQEGRLERLVSQRYDITTNQGAVYLRSRGLSSTLTETSGVTTRKQVRLGSLTPVKEEVTTLEDPQHGSSVTPAATDLGRFVGSNSTSPLFGLPYRLDNKAVPHVVKARKPAKKHQSVVPSTPALSFDPRLNLIPTGLHSTEECSTPLPRLTGKETVLDQTVEPNSAKFVSSLPGRQDDNTTPSPALPVYAEVDSCPTTVPDNEFYYSTTFP